MYQRLAVDMRCSALRFPLTQRPHFPLVHIYCYGALYSASFVCCELCFFASTWRHSDLSAHSGCRQVSLTGLFGNVPLTHREVVAGFPLAASFQELFREIANKAEMFRQQLLSVVLLNPSTAFYCNWRRVFTDSRAIDFRRILRMQLRITEYDYEFECPKCKRKQKRSIGWIRGSRILPCVCGNNIEAARIALKIEAIMTRTQSLAGGPIKSKKRKLVKETNARKSASCKGE